MSSCNGSQWEGRSAHYSTTKVSFCTTITCISVSAQQPSQRYNGKLGCNFLECIWFARSVTNSLNWICFTKIFSHEYAHMIQNSSSPGIHCLHHTLKCQRFPILINSAYNLVSSAANGFQCSKWFPVQQNTLAWCPSSSSTGLWT